jgi:hypothetical protein
MTVSFLRDLQIPQDAPGVLMRTDRDEAARGLDEVAGPHQVIATQVVVGLREAPRDRQTGNDPALDALRFVRAQHRGTGVVQGASRLRWDAAFERRLPGFPASDVLRSCALGILEQADQRVLARFHRGGTKAERHHERSIRCKEIDFARDGHVAVLCARVGFPQASVRPQLLPSIGKPDKPDRPGQPRGRGREREGVVLALGEQHERPLVIADPRRVATAPVGEVRGQQHVQPKIGQPPAKGHETNALKHDVAPRVGKHFLLDAIASVDSGVVNPIRRNAGGYRRCLGKRIPLFFREVGLAIRDDKAQVACARVVDAWIVNLVENPMA